MTIWQTIFLGIIQGITEFLPISSSGHLELAQHLLGLEQLDRYILFNLICHLGTLTAIFCIFFKTIKDTFLDKNGRLFSIILGTLPLFPLVLILKPIKQIFNEPQYLGFCFLFSSLLIYLSVHVQIRIPTWIRNRRWVDPLTIGLFQAIAILPGVSRSGSTISAAQLLGWTKADSIHFSFLLAIPAILGGTVLEAYQVWKDPALMGDVNLIQFFLGFLTSFIMGLISLKLLIQLVAKDRWIYFSCYCLLIGLASIIYFNVLK